MRNSNLTLAVPDGFIVFISGVPGVGKSTISYELLKRNEEFRIIEETDIMRETLRGFSDYIKDEFKDKVKFVFDKIEIIDYLIPLTIEESVRHCTHMYRSLENIIIKQQRKGISSIINGVHIVPHILYEFAKNQKTIFINLYINNERELYSRIIKRDPNSYLVSHLPVIFKTNKDLHIKTLEINNDNEFAFNSIDITSLSVTETLEEVEMCIKKLINIRHAK